MNTTTTYRWALSELHAMVDDLDRGFADRLERWLGSQPVAERPSLTTFVSQAILSDGGLSDVVDPEWEVFFLVDEGEGEPWSHVAFFAGYGEHPAPASLFGFEWHSEIGECADELKTIASRAFYAFRQLAPALVSAVIDKRLEGLLRTSEVK